MEKNLYRQTTVGYWFCMFVTNSLSRRTVLQINLRQLHSVPCATRYASLPAPTSCFQAKVGTMMLQMWHVCRFYYCSNPATAVDLVTMQFSRSHGQPLQKPREVQEMLKIPVYQSSLVSRTFSVHIRIWMFTLCAMHLVSTFTSEPRKEVKR